MLFNVNTREYFNSLKNLHKIFQETIYQIAKTFRLEFRIPFYELGMVVHTCNPSTRETKPRGLQVQANRSYLARPCLKIQTNSKILFMNTVS
jgi:hypothetical protein